MLGLMVAPEAAVDAGFVGRVPTWPRPNRSSAPCACPGALDNENVADLLDEYARLRRKAGDQPYRVGAYQRAATSIGLWPDPVLALVKKGWDPRAIPGIGPSLSAVLREIADRGTWKSLEESRKRYRLDVGDPRPTADRRRTKMPAGTIQLKGDLHTHTAATDGRDSILAMAEAAQALGYEYLAITDHSQETRIAGGLDEARMGRHLGRIRRVAEKVEGIALLAGSEVDIKKDGSLDFPRALLKKMDVVVCSVHFRHKLSGPEQTERILAGMSNDCADILGHPSGRREGIRPGMEIDLPRIIEAAKDQGWCIEMNGSPERMDLDGQGGRLAADAGVTLALDSDAHSTRELDQVHNALRQARMAGLTEADVVNALPLAKLRKKFAR